MRVSIDLNQENIVHFPATTQGLSIKLIKKENSVTISLEAIEAFNGNVRIHFVEDLSKILVPAVWYLGNNEGEGVFPSERKAQYWCFDEQRMPIHGMIAGKKERGWIYLWLSSAVCEEYLMSAGWDKQGFVFHLPSEEFPFSYRSKAILADGEKKSIELKEGECFKRTVCIYSTEEENPYLAFKEIIYSYFNESTQVRDGWDYYEKTKLHHLVSMVRPTTDGKATIIMGSGNGEVDDVYQFTAGSFLVKALEAATVFYSCSPAILDKRDRQYLASILQDNPDNPELFENLAKNIGEYFLSSETAEGFYQDCVNLNTGERGGYLGISEHPEYRNLMNSRCTGEAMSSYLDLYRQTGDKRFKELPERVASFFLRFQLSDGSFGRWWDSQGNCVDSKGTNGSYIALFLLKLGVSGEPIEKALNYYSSLAIHGGFHGDTLDADSTDKEAGVSILALMLEGIEKGYKENALLEAADIAASFILTWIWQEDTIFPKGSPLEELNFHTEGMTSVSVAHHHLDFYGMLIAYLYLRLWRITGEDIWHNQAIRLMNACQSLIADEGNGFLGRSPEYYGWQPEQMNHTHWDYFQDGIDKAGTYGIDIAWLNVLGLSSFRHIKHDFPSLFC